MDLAIILTVVFIVLKLFSVIDWEWKWVLSPVWMVALTWLMIIAVLARSLS